MMNLGATVVIIIAYVLGIIGTAFLLSAEDPVLQRRAPPLISVFLSLLWPLALPLTGGIAVAGLTWAIIQHWRDNR